jgi:hypothetical protein
MSTGAEHPDPLGTEIFERLLRFGTIIGYGMHATVANSFAIWSFTSARRPAPDPVVADDQSFDVVAVEVR